MRLERLVFFVLKWVRNLFSGRAIIAILSSFGALWLVVQITTFFFYSPTIAQWLRDKWWLFAIAGGLTAIWKCLPSVSVAHSLRGRDVTVEIAVGDVFSFPGALVVGSNTTFDTQVSPKLIAWNSVQGIFTGKYYADETLLDNEILAGLSSVESRELSGQREGKGQRYPIGTVVRLNPKGRTAYLVAIADINENGVAEGSFEKLRISLSQLWVYIGSKGLKGPIVMPALGTGFSRLTQKREEVVREIVKSFIAACSERVFADRLTIVLSPRDMAKHNVSLDELGMYLRHMSVYTEFSDGSNQPVGEAVIFPR